MRVRKKAEGQTSKGLIGLGKSMIFLGLGVILALATLPIWRDTTSDASRDQCATLGYRAGAIDKAEYSERQHGFPKGFLIVERCSAQAEPVSYDVSLSALLLNTAFFSALPILHVWYRTFTITHKLPHEGDRDG